MTTTSLASSGHPLLPYEVQPGRLLLASGVRAGDWIFASGLLPTRFGATARPLSGEPAWTIQCRSVWERAQTVLAAGGTDLAHLVRRDQFLPDWRAIPFLHAVCREVCGAHIPPSISVLAAGLLVPETPVTMHLVTVAPGGPALLALFPPGLAVPATSSFVPVMQAGGMVFVAGLLVAHGKGDLGVSRRRPRCPRGISGKASASGWNWPTSSGTSSGPRSPPRAPRWHARCANIIMRPTSHILPTHEPTAALRACPAPQKCGTHLWARPLRTQFPRVYHSGTAGVLFLWTCRT
jgi:enamine deaminase RidA (YjgF/YER057c/UK114 family)